MRLRVAASTTSTTAANCERVFLGREESAGKYVGGEIVRLVAKSVKDAAENLIYFFDLAVGKHPLGSVNAEERRRVIVQAGAQHSFM